MMVDRNEVFFGSQVDSHKITPNSMKFDNGERARFDVDYTRLGMPMAFKETMIAIREGAGWRLQMSEEGARGADVIESERYFTALAGVLDKYTDEVRIGRFEDAPAFFREFQKSLPSEPGGASLWVFHTL
jgi:hypothetical protein